MRVGPALQAAAMTALDSVSELGSVHDGPPVQAVPPYAVVDAGSETDWGHKSGIGREVRLAVTIRDEGERPQRLQRLLVEAETALAGVPSLPGWQLVTMRLASSRVAKDRQRGWLGLIELRARLLAL